MGWLEKWGLKLISTQVVVEVEVGVELGNIEYVLSIDVIFIFKMKDMGRIQLIAF